MRLAALTFTRQNGRMTLRALLLCGLLAGCSSLAPTQAQPVQTQEIDPGSYAAADLAAIRKEAGELDLGQLQERMEALRDANWNNAAPAIPASAPVSLELAITSSFYGVEISLIAWRDPQGQWQWRRAKHDAGRNGGTPSASTADGIASPAQSAELDRQLASAVRRAEVWYSPPATPLKDGGEDACHDGLSSLLAIHRSGQPDEIVVQSCTTRWLNGKLIDFISASFRD